MKYVLLLLLLIWSTGVSRAQHDHDHEGCSHDHEPAPAVVPHDHDGDGKPDHDEHASHDGHDHGNDEGLALAEDMVEKAGIQMYEAVSGTVARASTFPAEIKLNKDTAAAVSPRYSSIVRQVFSEIGDEVKEGDILASLENRETMAVYAVFAPQNGVIISKDLAVGETAGEDRVLYEVADLSSVWADISIFPNYQHQVRKGMLVKFIAHDGHTAQGVIKYISPIVNHETRTLTARCVLKDARDDFTPGVFVRAQINVESVNAKVVVPREAVQILDGEPVVFIPKGETFITAPVKTGLADEANIEIKSGLEPGATYVGAGAFSLKAQMVTSGMDPHAGHGH